MSLPDELWAALDLDQRVVDDRARFFQAYASLDEPRYPPRDLMRLTRDGPPLGTRRTVVDLLDDEDEDAEVVRRHLRNLGGSEEPPPWIRVAAVADAWRQSAICRAAPWLHEIPGVREEPGRRAAI